MRRKKRLCDTSASNDPPSPRLLISKARKTTHLPAKASFGVIPHDLVLALSCLKDLKTPPRCLPSGNACSQKRAPRQSGISRTLVILVTSIFLIVLNIRAIGGAQLALLPSHDMETHPLLCCQQKMHSIKLGYLEVFFLLLPSWLAVGS